MCGICGWVTLTAHVVDPSILTRMITVLGHRGPDATGEWWSENCALGHTRLSILDIDGGSQPMVDETGAAIVFNGEIYNYRDIKAQLKSKGVVFRTRSDTEVVLKAYREWGDSCVNHLEGMFAFAIMDPIRKQLYLARDHFGKKPLYFFFQDGIFIFGSEIKAILQSPVVHDLVEIDDRALVDYMSIGYILAPKTIFQQIKQLQPASYAIIDCLQKTFTEKKYWKYEESFRQKKTDVQQSELEEEFRTIFSSAVERRLHADVPVGGYLSSGLDSASVVATVRDFNKSSFRAFNIGFEQDSFDESAGAKEIASALGVDLEVQMFEELGCEDLSRLVWHFDQPFSDNSAYPTYQLNQLAGMFGKVMISGDGADEIFAGYPTYRADQIYSLYRKLPLVVQQGFSRNADKWIRPTYRKVSSDYKIKQFLGAAGLTREEAHYWWRVVFPKSTINNMLDPEVLRGIDEYSPSDVFLEYFKAVDDLPFLDRALYVDTQTWLHDDILVKVDRMSMANSVEVRCPFLDRHVAEFAAQLPVSQKMNLWKNKTIVRNSMRESIPPSAYQSRKQGFNAPLLSRAEVNLPKDPRFVREYWFHPGKEDVTFKQNNLLVLNLWFDMFSNYKNTGCWEPTSYGY